MTVNLSVLERLLAEATERPWFRFHVDDCHAMNCFGVTSDPDFERTEDYIGPGDGSSRRIIALTLYQAYRVVEHEGGRWHKDAALIAEAVNNLPDLLAAAKALYARHDAECGCSTPGDPTVCADGKYEALAAFSSEEQA